METVKQYHSPHPEEAEGSADVKNNEINISDDEQRLLNVIAQIIVEVLIR